MFNFQLQCLISNSSVSYANSQFFWQLKQLVLSGELACTKEEAASLAVLQLRIEEKTCSVSGANPTLNVQSPPHQAPTWGATTPLGPNPSLGIPGATILKRPSIPGTSTPFASTPNVVTPKGSTMTLPGLGHQSPGHSPIVPSSPILPQHLQQTVSTLPPHLQQSTTNLLAAGSTLHPGAAFSFGANVLPGTFGSALASTMARRYSAVSTCSSNLLNVPTSHGPNLQPRVSTGTSFCPSLKKLSHFDPKKLSHFDLKN